MNVAAADVETADDQPSGPRERSTGMHLALCTLQRKAMKSAPSWTCEASLPKKRWISLAKYLDEALLANLQTARIIHGKGTGALRTAYKSIWPNAGK